MDMNRRNYLAASALAVAGLAGASGKRMQARPNILWIMTDQQVADGMGCTGNPDLETPAMDSLAANGIRFERAYCTNPICVPSRASMMTGRMPHEIGVTLNMDLFKILDTDWHGFNMMLEGGKPEFNDRHVAAPAIEFIRKKRNKPYFLVASLVNPHDICEWARRATGGFEKRRTLLWNGAIADTPPPDQCPALPANFQIPENEPDIIREYQTWQEGTYPVRDWPDERWRQYRWALNRLTERVDSEIAKLLDVVDDNTLILFTSDHGDGNGAHKWNQKTLLYERQRHRPTRSSRQKTPSLHRPRSLSHLLRLRRSRTTRRPARPEPATAGRRPPGGMAQPARGRKRPIPRLWPQRRNRWPDAAHRKL